MECAVVDGGTNVTCKLFNEAAPSGVIRFQRLLEHLWSSWGFSASSASTGGFEGAIRQSRERTCLGFVGGLEEGLFHSRRRSYYLLSLLLVL